MTSAPFKIAPTIRALLLVRVSTKDQATKKGTTRHGKTHDRSDKVSDRLQEQKCRALAHEIMPTITEGEMLLKPDLGVSGLKEERLEEIVAAAEASPRPKAAPGYVLALNVSRFCRLEMLRAMGYLDRLDRAGWLVRFDFPRRSGTLMADNLMLAVLIEMAAEYSRGLKEYVAPAMRHYAEQGEVQGGRPVAGFIVGRDGHYVPKAKDDPDVVTMRRAFAAFAGGATLDAVAAEAGILATTLRHRFQNPTYIGVLSWGRRKSAKTSGERIGAHPGIITREVWDAVQERLAANGTRPARRSDGLPYVLSGLVRGSCGHPLYGAGGIRKHATPAERLRYAGYRCKVCNGSRVNQVLLERTVLQTVVTYLQEEDASGRLEQRLARWVGQQTAARSSAAIAKQRAALLKRKTQLLDIIEHADTPDPDVRKRLQALTTDLARLDAAKPDPKAVQASAARTLSETRAFIAQGTNITPEAANASLGRLLRLIPSISYDHETRLVEVNYLGAAGTELATVPHSRDSNVSPVR